MVAGRAGHALEGQNVSRIHGRCRSSSWRSSWARPSTRPDANGDTALHIAATRRRDAIVQALADSGAALNVRNHDGRNAPGRGAQAARAGRRARAWSDDYEYLLKHTDTAELLRKLGATT